MSENTIRQNWVLCLLSGLMGGVVSSIFTIHAAPVNASSEILRVKDLRIVGPNGKDQILLNVSSEGPQLRVIDKDDTQEIALEILDNTSLPNKSWQTARFAIRNLKSDHRPFVCSAYPDGSAGLRMGESHTPGYVFLQAEPSGPRAGSNLCLGFPIHKHFECSISDKIAKVNIGGFGSCLKLIDEEKQLPSITMESLVKEKVGVQKVLFQKQ